MRAALALSASMMLLPAFAGVARAHPLVDEGSELLERARFGEALARFERAAAADDLRLEDVVRLLEGRSLAHRALSDERAMDADLRALAALRPDHVFPAHAPPELAWRFRVVRERAEGPLRVRVEVLVRDGRATIRTHLSGAPPGLVRGVRVAARTGDARPSADAEREWQRSGEGQLQLAVGERESLEYHVAVVGLGGAVLLEEGSAEAPLPVVVLPIPGSEYCPTCDASGGAVTVDAEPWPWVVGGGLAVIGVALGVVAIVVLTAPSSDDTAPGAPMRVPLLGSWP